MDILQKNPSPQGLFISGLPALSYHEPEPAFGFAVFACVGFVPDPPGVVQAGEVVGWVGVGQAYAPAFQGRAAKGVVLGYAHGAYIQVGAEHQAWQGFIILCCCHY